MALELDILKKKQKSSQATEILQQIFFRKQAFDSLIWGHFFVGFFDFMLKGKYLLEYTNVFSPSKYKKNDETILKCFQKILKRFR